MSPYAKPTPITQPQLDELKKSPQHASKLLKSLNLKGWPRVITPEPNKHFLTHA